MNNKFENLWDNLKNNIETYSEKGKVKIGWETCKKEIIKILKSKNNNNWYESLDEIEKEL